MSARHIESNTLLAVTEPIFIAYYLHPIEAGVFRLKTFTVLFMVFEVTYYRGSTSHETLVFFREQRRFLRHNGGQDQSNVPNSSFTRLERQAP